MGGALSPKSVCWFQKFSRDSLHEIYELAVKYDGTISEKGQVYQRRAASYVL